MSTPRCALPDLEVSHRPTAAPAVVTVVHSPGCHFCQDAMDALEQIAREHPLSVELVPAGDPAGAALVRRHRASMFPLVLVDGAFFSAGRLPRTKLRALLARRSAVA